MFNNISWYDYWTSLAVITFAYYLAVYLLYFRNRNSLSFIKQILIPRDSVKEDRQPALFDNQISEFQQPSKDSEEYIVYACMDELNAFFDNQKKSKAVKSEVMFALHGILQKYPALKSSEYKDSLFNVIATQCENVCSIHLSAEEMKGVWFG